MTQNIFCIGCPQFLRHSQLHFQVVHCDRNIRLGVLCNFVTVKSDLTVLESKFTVNNYLFLLLPTLDKFFVVNLYSEGEKAKISSCLCHIPENSFKLFSCCFAIISVSNILYFYEYSFISIIPLLVSQNVSLRGLMSEIQNTDYIEFVLHLS